jgi:hypothetical protein
MESHRSEDRELVSDPHCTVVDVVDAVDRENAREEDRSCCVAGEEARSSCLAREDSKAAGCVAVAAAGMIEVGGCRDSYGLEHHHHRNNLDLTYFSFIYSNPALVR